jgi:hypothetical protein
MQTHLRYHDAVRGPARGPAGRPGQSLNKKKAAGEEEYHRESSAIVLISAIEKTEWEEITRGVEAKRKEGKGWSCYKVDAHYRDLWHIVIGMYRKQENPLIAGE